jgi:type IV pilus assembly protein PilV
MTHLHGTHTMPKQRRIAGFTLIEVMVALIVLVLGVLGAAAMTLTALRDGKQSGLRAQASALAYEAGDLMRANPGQETIFTGSVPVGVATCYSTGCVPSDMAKNDFFEWNAKLTGTSGLPNGAFVICRDTANMNPPTSAFTACDNAATSPLVVKLRWDEKINYARGQTGTSATVPQYLAVIVQPY